LRNIFSFVFKLKNILNDIFKKKAHVNQYFVKKTAASPPKEGEMSARIIFLQVGAYVPTCKKIILALKRASPPRRRRFLK
jgi:hypothetical protein